MSNSLDFTGWSCPIPLRSHPNIVMGHGGGGKLSAELLVRRLRDEPVADVTVAPTRLTPGETL